MERQAASTITVTVRACLDECRTSDIPLDVVAATIHRLRQSGWHEGDVRRVQTIVHRVLVAVLAGEKVEHSEIDVPVADPQTSQEVRPGEAES